MVSGGIIKQRFSRRGEFVLRHHTNHTENTDIVNQIIKISKIYKPAEISKKRFGGRSIFPIGVNPLNPKLLFGHHKKESQGDNVESHIISVAYFYRRKL